jgi:molecular chaperone Hsp33
MKHAGFDSSDLIQPFQLEESQIRGRLVRLGSSLDLILKQHAYPDSVAHLLAETAAVAAVLADSLKFKGIFTLQAKGSGAIRMLVADVTSDGAVRAYAQFSADELGDATGLKLLGKGYLAFTVDQGNDKDRYQGIVELNSATIAEAVQHYFRKSEQIPTAVMVEARKDAAGRWHAGALMLQRMPREGGYAKDLQTDTLEDDWHRVMILMSTCTPQELAEDVLSPNDLLYRLFHEEGVRVYDQRKLRHQCRCSQERVVSMLQSLPREEVEAMTVDDTPGGDIKVTCEFCNRSYTFSRKERDALLGPQK